MNKIASSTIESQRVNWRVGSSSPVNRLPHSISCCWVDMWNLRFLRREEQITKHIIDTDEQLWCRKYAFTHSTDVLLYLLSERNSTTSTLEWQFEWHFNGIATRTKSRPCILLSTLPKTRSPLRHCWLKVDTRLLQKGMPKIPVATMWIHSPRNWNWRDQMGLVSVDSLVSRILHRHHRKM